MSGDFSIGAPVNKPYEVLKQSLKPYLTEIVSSDESAQPESKPTNESKTRTSFGIQNSLQRLDGDNLWDGKLTFGAEKNGTHAEFAFGYGQVASANLKAGHEFRWGDFGLDLSATASARKATADKIESQNQSMKIESNVHVYNNEQGSNEPIDDVYYIHSSQTTEFTVYNKYKPSDIEAGLEVMGTYRPTKGVKLGLGGKAVYSMPTTPDTKYHDVGYTESIINVQVDNPTQEKPENVSLVQGCSLGEVTFEHDRTPKVSFRGLANAEIDLTKSGNCKATLELETGKKVMFGIKRFF